MKKRFLMGSAVLFVLISIAISALIIYHSAKKEPLTPLENSLMQIFTFLFGIAGSFLFGNVFLIYSAEEKIRPHARSALRRVISLYIGLSQIAAYLQESKVRFGDQDKAYFENIEKYMALVIQLIQTLDDALNDWKDIIPEDVQDIIDKFDKRKEVGT